jgi:hypothetical protein
VEISRFCVIFLCIAGPKTGDIIGILDAANQTSTSLTRLKTPKIDRIKDGLEGKALLATPDIASFHSPTTRTTRSSAKKLKSNSINHFFPEKSSI